ncbi:hypothetical protein [Paenibacillus caui]|uniref:hypothetical protein n=1 Tax=Paenibacillus caui TaxID=2873927 RepID=UPI001CA91BEA|nr:hypothetical protein [Paenibacillus caui]
MNLLLVAAVAAEIVLQARASGASAALSGHSFRSFPQFVEIAEGVFHELTDAYVTAIDTAIGLLTRKPAC